LFEFFFGQPDVQPPVSVAVFLFHDLLFFNDSTPFNLKVSLPASSEQRAARFLVVIQPDILLTAKNRSPKASKRLFQRFQSAELKFHSIQKFKGNPYQNLP